MTIGVEHVDKAIACAGHVIVFVGELLLRIRDKEIAVDVLDAERRKTGGDVRIDEAAVGRYRDLKAIGAAAGSGPEHVYSSSVEIGSKKENTLGVGAENKTFVDGAAR